MRLNALTLYTPTKASDGEGGSTETLGTGTTIWGAIQVHAAGTTMVCRQGTVLAVNDVVLADSAQYRVVGVREFVSAPYVSADLERIERPIKP